MRSMTLTGAALLVGALLAGCGDESGPTGGNMPALMADATTTTDHTSFIDPLEETVISPCNAETILLTGSAQGQSTFVGDGSNLLHYEIMYVVQETGIGQTTGARYVLRDVLHEGFDSPSEPAVNAVFTFREANHFITSVKGLSFTGVSALHVLRLPSGELKFTRDVFVDFNCQG